MTETMQAMIVVDEAAALRAGKAEHGQAIVPVDPAGLGPEQREELLRCPVYGAPEQRCRDPYRVNYPDEWDGEGRLTLPPVPDASMASLAALLDARPAALSAYREAFHAAVAEQVAAALDAPAEDWLALSASHWCSTPHLADAPYDVRRAVEADPRVQARLAAAEQQAAAEVDRREAANRVASQRAAEAMAAKAAEVADWIATHGSARLKRLAKEGIEAAAVYRDERLALERPGWSWGGGDDGLDPRNASEEAIDLLDRARATAPDAVLRYHRKAVYNDGVSGYLKCWATFLGRPIVLAERSAVRAV